MPPQRPRLHGFARVEAAVVYHLQETLIMRVPSTAFMFASRFIVSTIPLLAHWAVAVTAAPTLAAGQSET